jgi:hypothetical protein
VGVAAFVLALVGVAAFVLAPLKNFPIFG